MSTSSRRRNGSQASCEGCRKAKIRCDHSKPICSPCRRRGLGSQCWYHPAPLTKQRDFQGPTPPTPTYTERAEHDELEDNSAQDCSAGRLPNFLTWSSILRQSNGTASRAPIYEPPSKKVYEGCLAVVEEMVAQLKFLPFIEKLLDEYFAFSQVALVPRPIIIQLVTSILVIISSLDLEGFCALFCGVNLCVETLGLLLTIAARSYMCGVVRDEKKDEGFIRRMIRCSNLGLQLARDISTQTNDFIGKQASSSIWQQLGLTVWRRLGDLTTDLFALGLHREATCSAATTPFFLAECRRKTFATAYHLDKIFVAFFNRPPRISARYMDCNPPLDLSEDELFSTTLGISETARNGGCLITTWARIRYILAGFSEEIIEYQFRSVQALDHAKSSNLLDRCRQSWDSHPRHLRYDQDCSKENLSYLHIKFQICRLLGERGTTNQPEMIRISTSMLEAVVKMANTRSRATFIPQHLPALHNILSYGLTSAVVLTTVLHDSTRDPLISLPPDVNRYHFIRHLSVLVSQLESDLGDLNLENWPVDFDFDAFSSEWNIF
ncbi:hypothetical protein F4804DRAFT_342100 [Jackrogersella minutella]|nr:hypothetical protein F4804DRAFT_342100 [Jackrogersella minutella]